LGTRYLVITEKPSSAAKIAHALDENGSPKRAKHGGVSFYVANRGGDELVVVSAVGHLYSIDQTEPGWTYPVFDLKWVPTYTLSKKASHTRPYLNAIVALSRDADVFVSACDYDQEGSLIAYNIIKYGIGEDALTRSRRMIYNTLTSKDIVTSWETMNNDLDYAVATAGKTRHEVDWLFGINLSRALTLAARRYLDSKTLLSVGRVQGPTLRFIYEHEHKIRCFIPLPYWKIYSETMIQGETYPLEYEKPRLEREIHAKEAAKACRGKTGTVTEITSQESRTWPPPPFNLGDLQREAYKHYKMTPSATLKTAEKLYLKAYISYPRTESNKLPPSINIKEILENLSQNSEYSSIAKELIVNRRYKPRQGKGEDPAHPAIYPTGQQPKKLGETELRIYDLVVRRFLASLGAPMVRLKTTVTIDVNGHLFYLYGQVTKQPGWSQQYGRYYSFKDQEIPQITMGQEIPVVKLSTRRHYTRPSPRFNPSTLVHKMKQEKIGTKATRSNILDTLYSRGYIRGQSIVITTLGEAVIEVFTRYCPQIIDVKLTRELEKKLMMIEAGDIDSSAVIGEVVDELKPILAQFKKNENQIGRAMYNVVMGKPGGDAEACRVCHRVRVEGSVFCSRHTAAYEALEAIYPRWRYALGYQWIDYLKKVTKTPGTGRYVKEVVESIIR